MAKRRTRKQQLRDPNARSKLPDSALTPTQLRQRKQNQAVARRNKDPLYDPNAQLSGQKLYSAVKDLVSQELDPQIAAKTREIDNSRTQGTALLGQTAGLYRQQGAVDTGTVQRQQALSQMLSQNLANISTGQRTLADQAQVRQQQFQVNDQAQRGGGLEGGNQAQGELEAQRARMEAQNQTMEQQGAAQGANWASLANQLAQTRGLQAGETQQRLGLAFANAQGKMAGERADLEGQRGPLTTKTLLSQRQSSFENAAVADQLKLKTADMIADEESKKRQRQVQYSQQRSTARQQALNRAWQREKAAADRSIAAGRADETRRHNREMERLKEQGADTGGGGAKPRTSGQNDKAVSTVEQINQDIMGYHRDPKVRQRVGPNLRAHLIKKGASNTYIDIAEDLRRNKGKLSPRGVKKARELGIRIPSNWR